MKAAQARRACRESGRRRRNTRQRCDFDAGRARALAVGSDIINDDNWGPYFSTVAGASGAIFALLFVAMQVRIDAWRGEPVRIYAVALALFELAVPLMISLIAVMLATPRGLVLASQAFSASSPSSGTASLTALSVGAAGRCPTASR